MEKTLENYFLFIRNGVSIKQFDGDGIPITRIESISNEYLNFSKLGFANIYDENYKEYYLKNGDILMSHINSQKHLGKTAIIENLDKKVIHGMNLICLRPDMKKILPEYIFYFFKTKKFKKSIVKISKKSVNQASFSVGDLKKIKIEIPTLIYQEEVVKKLNKVKKILNDKKEQIKLLDELVKSRFIEMFLENENYPKMTLEELTGNKKENLVRGPFGGSLKKDDFIETGYLVYEQKHAIHNDFNYKKYYISKEKYQKMIRFKVESGDLIVSCSGTLGKIAEIPKEYKEGIINQALLKIKLDKNIINNKFFMVLFRMKYNEKELQRVSLGSGISNFPSMKEVRNFDFIVPPFSLQNEFSQFVEKTNKLKFEAEKSLKEMENLYESLMQKFFKQN